MDRKLVDKIKTTTGATKWVGCVCMCVVVGWGGEGGGGAFVRRLERERREHAERHA